MLDLDSQLDRMKESFLWAAAKGGREEEVLSLLNIGARVDWVSSQGDTALMAACREGHSSIAAVLLAHGSEASKMVGGESPLHACCLRGDENMCKLLIAAGADFNALDTQGRTAFDVGRSYGHNVMVERLRVLAAQYLKAEGSSSRETRSRSAGHHHTLPLLLRSDKHHMSHASVTDLPLLHDPQNEQTDESASFVLQQDAPRRAHLEEKADRETDRRRHEALEARSAEVYDELLSARATVTHLNAKIGLLRAELRHHQGYELNDMTVDELARLEASVTTGARRIARQREKLVAAAFKLPDAFLCPITREVLQDPVICSDGHTYSRHAIEQWLDAHDTSPKTGLPLKSKYLVPNYAIKSAIDEATVECKRRVPLNAAISPRA